MGKEVSWTDEYAIRRKILFSYGYMEYHYQKITHLQAMLSALEQNHGKNSQKTIAARSLLGMCYIETGQYLQAIPVLRHNKQCFDTGIISKNTVEYQVNYNNVRERLALALELSGKITESVALYQEIIIDYDNNGKGGETIFYRLRLAQIYLHSRDAKNAELILQMCDAITKTNSQYKWEKFKTQSLLGGLRNLQKRNSESEKLLLDGYNGMKMNYESQPIYERLCVLDAPDRLSEYYNVNNNENNNKWKSEYLLMWIKLLKTVCHRNSLN